MHARCRKPTRVAQCRRPSPRTEGGGFSTRGRPLVRPATVRPARRLAARSRGVLNASGRCDPTKTRIDPPGSPPCTLRGGSVREPGDERPVGPNARRRNAPGGGVARHGGGRVVATVTMSAQAFRTQSAVSSRRSRPAHLRPRSERPGPSSANAPGNGAPARAPPRGPPPRACARAGDGPPSQTGAEHSSLCARRGARSATNALDGRTEHGARNGDVDWTLRARVAAWDGQRGETGRAARRRYGRRTRSGYTKCGGGRCRGVQPRQTRQVDRGKRRERERGGERGRKSDGGKGPGTGQGLQTALLLPSEREGKKKTKKKKGHGGRFSREVGSARKKKKESQRESFSAAVSRLFARLRFVSGTLLRYLGAQRSSSMRSGRRTALV